MCLWAFLSSNILVKKDTQNRELFNFRSRDKSVPGTFACSRGFLRLVLETNAQTPQTPI